MFKKQLAIHVERLGLLLGGAIIGLAAQWHGWIAYTDEWQFWLIPIMIMTWASERYLRNHQNEAEDKEHAN